MRIVLDTNVVVSGLHSPSGVPARLIEALAGSPHVLLYDVRILAEYREVLARPKFAERITPERAASFVRGMEERGERIDATGTALAVTLPDPDDAPFAEVAIAGKADALVTGNRKHFPAGLGVPVLSPRELLNRLGPEPAG